MHITRQATYHVAIPVFQGPLDLLLHLIEREELDITSVSLSQVTNQYLEHLARLERRDPDSMAGFLVVAAKLLLIKSRVLLPQPPSKPGTEDTEENEDELIRQLIEYKRYKDAAHWLEEMESRGQHSYVRIAPPPDIEREVDLEGVTLDAILAAVREVLEVTPPAPSVDTAVPPVVITIADQMELIERETGKGRTTTFRHLLHQANTRMEVVVTLLALLEMIKQMRIRVEQSSLFGDIVITRNEPPQDLSQK